MDGGRYNQAMHSITLALLLSLHLPALAAEVGGQMPAISLAELASRSDLVVLAQARDTDYLRRRGIPVSGSAYLQVLIPYKTDQAVDIVEVYEKGLHDNECYFPNPGISEEGRRYLLFLRRDPEDEKRYRGLAEGCALDVLVDDDNRYAVQFPASGINLSDSLEPHARKMTFRDNYAIVSDDALPPALRNAMLATGQIEPYPRAQSDSVQKDSLSPANGPDDRRWIYTTGIRLTTIRELMGAENLAH
jgi:hypothetical protein